MTVRMIAVLIAVFSSGCVSQSSINKAIDQKIAANNVAFVQPMMAQQNLQISAVRTDVIRNQQAISKSNAQVSVHQNVLIDHYMKQQQQAASALSTLVPETTSLPLATLPNPTAPTLSAPASAAEVVPEPVAPATSE